MKFKNISGLLYSKQMYRKIYMTSGKYIHLVLLKSAAEDNFSLITLIRTRQDDHIIMFQLLYCCIIQQRNISHYRFPKIPLKQVR